MNDGSIHSDYLSTPNEAYLTADQYHNGLRRYAQVALVLGMDAGFKGCHSQFLVNYKDEKGIDYGTVGNFYFNEPGENRASEKITHLNDNPEHKLVASPRIGDIRYEWPGVIRLPHQSGAELILANSGVPDYMDVLLIAAFAIGVNEHDSGWSLENFDANSQYAWALRQAARFIIIANELDLDYQIVIDDDDFDHWIGQDCPNEPMKGILKDALDNF